MVQVSRTFRVFVSSTFDDLKAERNAYQLTGSEDWAGVDQILTDVRFLERKTAEVGVIEQTGADSNPTKLWTGAYQLHDDFDHALRVLGGESDDPRHRIVVTAVDLGSGLEIRCPHCNRMIPWQEEYRDQEMECPLTDPDCSGPLIVNRFVVGERV